MSQADLRPNITSTKQAQWMGRKGGRSRSIAKKLIHRKFCNSSCPLWLTCWAKHVSETVAKKEEEETGTYKPRCALKELPSQTVERTVRLIKEGENGFHQEMIEQLVRFGNDIGVSPSVTAREKYLFQLREVLKVIYGDKRRFEGKIDTNVLTAEHFAVAYNESKKEGENEDETKKH